MAVSSLLYLLLYCILFNVLDKSWSLAFSIQVAGHIHFDQVQMCLDSQHSSRSLDVSTVRRLCSLVYLHASQPSVNHINIETLDRGIN
jgi:hypothetical protein